MSDGPRLLYYDIENAPSLAWVWQTRDIDSVIAVESEWYMLSVAWKWQGEKRTHVLGLDDFPGYHRNPENDKPLLKELWKLFDEADVTIAHNGDRFDRRKSNARFLANGLGPPSPYQTFDTLKVARQHFMFNSNKLDDLGRQLGVGRKASAGGWRTWLGCMAGDPKSWATMKKYNKQDVNLLEDVYVALRPWASTHPNLALIGQQPDACPRCGVAGEMVRRGTRYVATVAYSRFRCRSCGGYSRERASDKSADKPRFVV